MGWRRRLHAQPWRLTCIESSMSPHSHHCAEVEVIEEDPSYVFNFPTPTDLGVWALAAGGCAKIRQLESIDRVEHVPVPGSATRATHTHPQPPYPTVSPPVLGFTDVDFAYPGGPRLFRDINFGIGLESRFAIVGPNGIGKSTMLGLISGTLEPTKGFIHRNSKVPAGCWMRKGQRWCCGRADPFADRESIQHAATHVPLANQHPHPPPPACSYASASSPSITWMAWTWHSRPCSTLQSATQGWVSGLLCGFWMEEPGG